MREKHSSEIKILKGTFNRSIDWLPKQIKCVKDPYVNSQHIATSGHTRIPFHNDLIKNGFLFFSILFLLWVRRLSGQTKNQDGQKILFVLKITFVMRHSTDCTLYIKKKYLEWVPFIVNESIWWPVLWCLLLCYLFSSYFVYFQVWDRWIPCFTHLHTPLFLWNILFAYMATAIENIRYVRKGESIYAILFSKYFNYWTTFSIDVCFHKLLLSNHYNRMLNIHLVQE